MPIVLFIIAFLLVALITNTITYGPFLVSGSYGIVLIYGIMGSGKSTLIQKWIYKFASKGGRIYTNYQFTGAQLYDPKILGHVKFPENSLIIVDEAGTIYNNRDWKNTPQELLIGLKDIRKNKNRIIFVSQNTDIDKQIRDAAHRIYILKKSYLFSTAKLVLKIMDITNNAGDSANSNGGDIIYKFTYGNIFTGEGTYLPRGSYGFDSFETITDLPYFTTYDVDTNAYKVLDRKPYRKHKHKYIKDRGKHILTAPANLFRKKETIISKLPENKVSYEEQQKSKDLSLEQIIKKVSSFENSERKQALENLDEEESGEL